MDAQGHTVAFLRALANEDTAWKEQAACRGSDVRLFFPDRWVSRDPAAAAKAVCATCPVTFECADYGARYSPRDGVWGGMAPKQRYKWRKTRGLGPDREKRCGKVSTYGNGCRCDECRAAKAAYEREYRKRAVS